MCSWELGMVGVRECRYLLHTCSSLCCMDPKAPTYKLLSVFATIQVGSTSSHQHVPLGRSLPLVALFSGTNETSGMLATSAKEFGFQSTFVGSGLKLPYEVMALNSQLNLSDPWTAHSSKSCESRPARLDLIGSFASRAFCQRYRRARRGIHLWHSTRT